MILIIDKNKRDRESAAEMFYYMGFLSYPVSPEDAICELSGLYRAVLFNSTDGIADLDEYVASLRAITDIPFFAIGECDSPYFKKVFSDDAYSSTVALGIGRELVSLGYEGLGIYQASGFDASADLKCALYLGEEIDLTKTERMILRLLIRAYPEYLSVADVLKYAYRQAKRPEAASVRTHISIMNKKFSRQFERPLASSEVGKGYALYSDEIERMLTTV